MKLSPKEIKKRKKIFTIGGNKWRADILVRMSAKHEPAFGIKNRLK